MIHARKYNNVAPKIINPSDISPVDWGCVDIVSHEELRSMLSYKLNPASEQNEFCVTMSDGDFVRVWDIVPGTCIVCGKVHATTSKIQVAVDVDGVDLGEDSCCSSSESDEELPTMGLQSIGIAPAPKPAPVSIGESTHGPTRSIPVEAFVNPALMLEMSLALSEFVQRGFIRPSDGGKLLQRVILHDIIILHSQEFCSRVRKHYKTLGATFYTDISRLRKVYREPPPDRPESIGEVLCLENPHEVEFIRHQTVPSYIKVYVRSRASKHDEHSTLQKSIEILLLHFHARLGIYFHMLMLGRAPPPTIIFNARWPPLPHHESKIRTYHTGRTYGKLFDVMIFLHQRIGARTLKLHHDIFSNWMSTNYHNYVKYIQSTCLSDGEVGPPVTAITGAKSNPNEKKMNPRFITMAIIILNKNSLIDLCNAAIYYCLMTDRITSSFITEPWFIDDKLTVKRFNEFRSQIVNRYSVHSNNHILPPHV